MAENIRNIEAGIGTKMGECLQNIIGFLSGLVIAFIVGWKLSFVACAAIPLLTAAFASYGFVIKFMGEKEFAAYSKAGTLAGEVLYAIRTVVAFGGEQKASERYTSQLKAAERIGIKKAIAFGASKYS